MFPEHNKITVGYVIQKFITLPNGTQVCQSQEFIAGDQVDYETLNGEPIEVDTTKEAYCPFDMKQPESIPDEDSLKFTCPDCGKHHIEAVLDGSHTCHIEDILKSNFIEYGDIESHGDLERFQCKYCGYVIIDENGKITDETELVEWIKENCKQE